MALFHVRLVIDRSVEGQDNVIWNVFGIDTAVDPEVLAPDLVDAWETAWGASTPAHWPVDHTFTSLELIPAGGGPAAGFAGFAPPLAMGNGAGAPSEVAIVVSHMVNTARGNRRRGRTYVGPIAAAQALTRPTADLLNFVGGAWADFHAAAAALLADPVVISTVEAGAPRVPPIGIPILSYVIDNAWDTQRSRGWDPSAATEFVP